MNSRRDFDELKIINYKSIDDHVTRKMLAILEKYEEEIKHVNVYNSELTESQMIEMLNKFKNLETLSFYDVTYNSTESDDVELKLSNLKSFEMQLCNLIIPRTILRVPGNSLEHLSINNCILDQRTVGRILTAQKTLRALEFDPYYVEPNLMADLQLRKLKLMSKRNVIPILKNQQNLLSLDLARAHISDDEFLQICKMKKLKSLKLWVDRISYEILDNLIHLNELEELSLNYDRLEIEYVIKVCTIFLPSITTLKIEFPKLKILQENFIAIAVNCPNIHHLFIKCQSIGVIGTILQNFKNLRTLAFGCDSDSVKVVNFPTNDIVNDNLHALHIYDTPFNNPAKDQFQSTLTLISLMKNSLPNLRKLKVSNILSLSASFFQEILSCKKLSYIDIDDISDNFHIDEHFMKNIVREYGNKLVFLKLSKVVMKTDEETIKSILGCHRFDYINCREWRNELILRNCEWNLSDD